MDSTTRNPKARTVSACLASAEHEARAAIFPALPEDSTDKSDWQPCAPAWKLNADNPRLVSLVEQVRRAELAESIGTVGIATAITGLVWMLGKCGPALLPGVFQ